MNDHDPTPLDPPETPALLREALAAARADGPSPAKLASLTSGLVASTSAAPAAAAAAAPSVLSGALVGGALGVLVSGAALIWPAREPAPAVAPTASPTLAPAPPTAAPPPSAAPARTPDPEPARAAPPPPRPVPTASVVPPAPAPSAASPAPAESELPLLQRAQEALAASPAQALSLTDEHAARFPAGSFGQEREMVAIQALLRLGRAAEARARADRFLAANPGSAYRRRIEALLGP